MGAALIQRSRPEASRAFSLERAQQHIARSDAQPAIKELEALRLDADVASPADVSDLFGPLVALYKGEGSSGDHLRLPRMTNLDGPAIRGALQRVLAAPSGGGAEEKRMRDVLAALEKTVSEIHRKSTVATKV
jgi:hypothetical protein